MAYSYLPHASVSELTGMKQLKLDILYCSHHIIWFFNGDCTDVLMKSFIKNKAIFKEPEEGARPPLWIRAIFLHMHR